MKFEGISKDVPLIDPFAAQRLIDPTIPAFSTNKTLAANQTAKVTSGYRNPERNEFFSIATTSRHMLGRALDVSISNISAVVSFDRGVAFYKAWEVIHRLTEPLPQPVYNPTRNAGFPDGASTAVPWADFWQLEGAGGPGDVILKSNARRFEKRAVDDVDLNGDNVLDGYARTFHLHIEDKPNSGVHR